MPDFVDPILADDIAQHAGQAVVVADFNWWLPVAIVCVLLLAAVLRDVFPPEQLRPGEIDDRGWW